MDGSRRRRGYHVDSPPEFRQRRGPTPRRNVRAQAKMSDKANWNTVWCKDYDSEETTIAELQQMLDDLKSMILSCPK